MSEKKRKSQEANQPKKFKQTKFTKEGKLSKKSDSEEEEMTISLKSKKNKSEKKLINKTISDIDSLEKILDDEEKYTKIISFNVGGLNGYLEVFF